MAQSWVLKKIFLSTPCEFFFNKGTLGWESCAISLATWGLRLPGTSGAQTPDPQIPSLMPWQCPTVTPGFKKLVTKRPTMVCDQISSTNSIISI